MLYSKMALFLPFQLFKDVITNRKFGMSAKMVCTRLEKPKLASFLIDKSTLRRKHLYLLYS